MILRGLNSARRTARVALTLTVFSAVAFVARAQGQIPSAMFQNSTLTGSGNTMTATRVPVRISSSLTIYVDITTQFNVDLNGNLTMSAGYPQIVPSAALLTANFKAGTYVAPSTLFNGKGFITVSGPGVSNGGATAWSLSTASGSDPGTTPATATWYVGPIANNPLAARLTQLGITSSAWSYGVGTGPNSGSWSSYDWGTWMAGSIIGVSQTGNAITIASFSFAGGDKASPQDQITFTLVP
jgi:hypothetical protein